MPDRETTRTLEGRHVLAITLTAFATIVTANMALVVAATGSFPGTVVEDAYVAGVGWDDRVAAQDALGWRVGARHTPDGRLAVAVEDAAGAPVRGLVVDAMVGRPARAGTDRAVTLRREGDLHIAALDLAPGLWRVALSIEGGTAPYAAVAEIVVPKARRGETPKARGEEMTEARD
ncbi:MAG: FixH family protein [Paracoccaceae bacterium]